MLAILGDVGAQFRQFPDLGTAWRTDGGKLRGENGRAVGAALREQVDRLVNTLGRGERARVAFVARLSTSFPTARNLRRLGRGRRRVRRRRLGRVLRGLAELGFKLFDPRLEQVLLSRLFAHDLE
jgi:hypothetical protein